ncbi:testis-specific protein TEX28 [Molossus molossus]|uniref:Testis expressed 28 n=1 Tax=Molossus molossus TaxID=27622 RepID=A0A7J8J9T5_MOLMO|nr:testis-specific protein TEX28 [Molossus molossus]KAF6493115.1 testis expressed 28 [Molossus molossus]
MILKVDYTKSPSATLPSNIPSCRFLSSSKKGPSSHSSLLDGEMARNLRESIKHRILYLSEQLKVEKASRDKNTVGYLKLVSKADRHQALHIRQAFEKVNQRASAAIAQIERKLRQCHQQLQELEEGCRPKRLVLKEESSLDNCQQSSEKALVLESPKLGGKDCLSTNQSERHFPLESHSPPALEQCTSSETKGNLLLQKAKEELKEVEEFHFNLRVSYQSLKERYLTDLQVSLESLQEEKCRQALMEELVNDHLQRHLNEIYHLKQNLAYTEEKMAYLSYERAKEIWEVMETFQSRISKLETLQQVTQLDVTENLRSCSQKFMFQFLNLLLTLATIFLVFIFTSCACPLPLLNSHLRTCIMLMLIGVGVLAWKKWHAIPSMDWQGWIPSRWRLYSKDSKPISDGS